MNWSLIGEYPSIHITGLLLRSAEIAKWNDYRRTHATWVPRLDNIDLREAVLVQADLSFAQLNGALLMGANLRDARLYKAILRTARLTGADLTGADLRDACLENCDLCDTNLRGADLRGANLTGALAVGAIYCYASLEQRHLAFFEKQNRSTVSLSN